MKEFELKDALAANFSISKSADKICDELRLLLGLQYRYTTARLAIGRALAEPSLPEPEPDAQGRPIKGDLLFGSNDIPLWAGVIFSHFEKYSSSAIDYSLETLQKAARRYWNRGAHLLWQDWQEAADGNPDGNYAKFIEILITRRAMLPAHADLRGGVLPEGAGATANPDFRFPYKPAPVDLKLGRDSESGSDFLWRANGKGYSPNVAIMGQAGSGKTRTMLELVKQAHAKSGAPVILLDLGKGDLADNRELAETIKAQVIRVPEQAIPLDMFAGSNSSDEAASDMALQFRESFVKVMMNRPGGVQLEAVKDGIKPLLKNRTKITLQDIERSIRNHFETAEVNPGIINSTLSDLNERELFTPTQSPQEFFSKSWIITFGTAQPLTKKLGAFLVLDALNNFLKRLDQAPTDSDGNRALRLILAIDEAKTILDAKHDALGTAMRLHRSKGLMVQLASQSPDDYDGASDDYLENIGLPICFKTNARSGEVLNNMFRSRPNFASLSVGTCLTIKDSKAIKVQAFD